MLLRYYLDHKYELLIALGALLAMGVVVRIVIGNPNGARHRTRFLRWRIRLYLRPGPGYANLLELAVRWSRLHAVWIGRQARPSLPWWERLVLPVTACAARLGRAHFGKRVLASMEDQTLVLAAPRKGKSGWLADRIIDHPGAVVTTTTRTDLYGNTAILRGRHGTVHVFNPEGIGGLPSTFRWDPLNGCEHPAIALQRAMAFTAATESKGLHDMTFWIGKASAVLASLFHAAAISGRTMHDVYQWAHGAEDDVPERILAAHPAAADGWLGPIREVRRPGRTADSIRMTVTRALAWFADPTVAAATSPGPGEGFDVAGFVCGRNTLYMIGAGRDEAPIAPLFRAFAEYVHTQAAFAGSLMPHGRLDPPMLLALDEVTQICPVPLPLWMADSAGKGILIVAVCHGLAQLEARWDSAGARAIWDTAGIKVILGGVTDPDTLDRLSRLCGEIRLRTHSRTHDHYRGRGHTVSYEPHPVLPPDLLRTLPEWRALIVRGNLSPVIVRLRMAWKRHDYHHTRQRSSAPHRPVPPAAAEPPEEPAQEIGYGLIVPPAPNGSPWHGQPGPHSIAADDELASRSGPHRPAAPQWALPPGTRPPVPRPSGRAAAPAPAVGPAHRPRRPAVTGPPQDRPGPRSVAALAIEVNGLRHDVTSLTTRAEEIARTQQRHTAAVDGIPELRRQVERILALLIDEDQSAAAGWFWLTMDRQAREDKLGELSDWVEAVLRAQYPSYLAEPVRPCWPNHPEALWELTWLYQLWCRAYLTKRPAPKDAADWHDRWTPGVLRRLAQVMARCDLACQSQPGRRSNPEPEAM